MAYDLLRSSSSYSLPEPIPSRRQARLEPSAKFSRFLKRLIHFDQMDFQFAAWQVLHLFLSPQRVYKKSVYRKQTKNQYSRDDPAFLVILMACIVLSALAMAVVLHLSLWGLVKLVLWLVLADCIVAGLVVASLMWFLASRFMTRNDLSGDTVEWGYAFDVHLNAFFPPLVIIHLFQAFFYTYFISQDWLLARLFGNTLWLLAAAYYCYITFLGYRALPCLRSTERILYSLAPAALVWLVATLSGINIMRAIMNFYEYRLDLYQHIGALSSSSQQLAGLSTNTASIVDTS